MTTARSDEDFPDVQPGVSGGYMSPLMSRAQTSGRLTLDLLQRDVPLFQSGLAATVALETETRPANRESLAQTVRSGRDAQDRIVLAAFPLIRLLAQRELRRRQQWRSQATFDDLAQEGNIGLIRGLKAYKMERPQKSATNYLGQWISTEMRRNAEDLDNDFGVAFDTAERFRRIRAMRSRLAVTLRREPTDEEVLAASVDPEYAARSPFAARGGALDDKDRPAPVGKPLSQAQLDQERDFRTRVGQTARLGEAAEDAPDLIESAQPLGDSTRGDAGSGIVDEAVQEAVRGLIRETLDMMGLPPVQREIVARRYGLAPHLRESSARDISRDLSLHRDRVSKVLEAFSEQMARSGGAFHVACSRLHDAELADLGLGWVLRALGPRPPARRGGPEPLPETLTMPMISRKHKIPPPSVTSGIGVFAQFHCTFHGSGFVGAYRTAAEIPPERDCPRCGRPSPAVRVMEP